ncbi:glycosyltransferase, partial [Halobium palmae]
GYVDHVESLVASATAVVYAPREEDFGMVGAEALVAGKPLLGVNEGFTRYQVEEGVTGRLFEPTVESVRETVAAFARVDRRAGALLLPYLAWVCFAALLNYRFLALNA